MPGKSIGIGIISYGYMGKVHSLCYREMPFYYDLKIPLRLVGVATPSRSSQERAVREAGFEFATSNPEELLARPDIDVIDICSPTYLHEEYVCRAAAAGKAIYIEKPLAHTLAAARRAYLAVNRNGARTGMAFEYRFAPALIRAKEFLSQGRIGSVINFRAIYQGPEHLNLSKLTWQLEAEKAGAGALAAQGSHLIDLIRCLIGEFESVCALAQKTTDGGDVEQVMLLQAKLECGAVGTLEVSQVAAGSNIDLRVEVYGTRGSLRFDNSQPNVLRIYELTDKELESGDGFREIQTMQRLPDAVFPPPRVDVNWLRYHLASQHRFIKALIEGTEPAPPTAFDGLKCQEVMEAACRSAREGRWVKLAEICS